MRFALALGVYMTDTINNVSEEIPKEEVVNPRSEPDLKTQSSDTPENTSSKSEDKSKDYNFRQMREILAQRDEELRILREHQAAVKEEELGEEDLVEGKHLKKGLQEIKEIIRQKELQTVPDRLRSKFQDFDQVVTKENLEKLKETEPEVYLHLRSGNGESLSANDLFTKGVAAYKTLTTMGFSQDSHDYMKQKDHVQSNHKKPLSAQAIKGSGALHEANIFANGLTPELKKQLQKEMIEAAKAR